MTSSVQRFEPIAIVGQGCVLPGALTPDALWSVVKEGRSVISGPPQGEWPVDPATAMDRLAQTPSDRPCTYQGGYVTGFQEVFDPEGFHVSASLIRELDVVFQWTLHAAREALHSANLMKGNKELMSAGIVMGNLSYPTSHLLDMACAIWETNEGLPRKNVAPFKGDIHPYNRFMSGLPMSLAAQALGLQAGSLALDAACSSSLYAIKIACDYLHDRRANIMVAGGVNAADHMILHLGFDRLQALSQTGQSRPFHREADGLLPAQGAACVILKRLVDAEKENHAILGVIRGIGLSNDGRTGGFLVPSVTGQVRAMQQAYAVSHLHPEEISLLECHATGTQEGDQKEILSMAEVFKGHQDLPIGSLKSNLGHLVTASGAASLLKVLHAMRENVRPPTLHANPSNVALEEMPFRLIHQLEPWDCMGPLRAGISNFGFGGNNAHLIVEQWAARKTAVTVPAPLKPDGDIAVVGLNVVTGDCPNISAFREKLFAEYSSFDHEHPAEHTCTRTITMDLKKVHFPPSELEHALAQQLALLKCALDLPYLAKPFSSKEMGAFIGMQCDAETARYLLRSQYVNEKAFSEELIDEAVIPPMEASDVLGRMPNIVANRLNNRFDIQGMSFTVSSEEHSGIHALEIAARALRRHELDVACVGAVDFCCETIHGTAARAVLPTHLHQPGDAAVLLILKRVEDALKSNEPIYAILSDKGANDLNHQADIELAMSDRGSDLAKRFGHAHAASGLLHVAAAVLACHHRMIPVRQKQQILHWKRQPGIVPKAKVSIDTFFGQSMSVFLQAAEQPSPDPLPTSKPPWQNPICFQGHPAPVDTGAIHRAQKQRRRATHLTAALPLAPPSLASTSYRLNLGDREYMNGALCSAKGLSKVHHAENVSPLVALSKKHMQRISELQQTFINEQSRLHQQVLHAREKGLIALLQPAVTALTPHQMDTATHPPKNERVPDQDDRRGIPDHPTADKGSMPVGPSFTREQLKIHASGNISELFGPLFKDQDAYALQVRMPEPPLLLVDRVIGLQGKAGSMKTGTIWTETDVLSNAWYLHEGYMPAGIMIEAGQADLMLISYLGIDNLNQGKRVYRLLGCEITYYGDLPKPGETLTYEIQVDGHATQNEVRLFFFSFTCYVKGVRRMRITGGQAGFFTEQELADSAGILWSPDSHDPITPFRLDPPEVLCPKHAFSKDEVKAFSEGCPWETFGSAFSWSKTHVRTPKVPSGNLLLMDRVTHFDVKGGPWKRGYLRFEFDLHPDDWFMKGHFKNDPCMPGTLMLEGVLQGMAFYLAAMGVTLTRDGWRFQPTEEEVFTLRCRGQATPTSKLLVGEIFVQEFVAEPKPTLYADFLVTIDGLKSLHAHRVGYQLVPDWPMTSRPIDTVHSREPKPVAEINGFKYDYTSLVASAWGKPSVAFGKRYECFDGTRKAPRLPGPPYHFMSRVTKINVAMEENKARGWIEIEYDVPDDAWYFDSNGAHLMPFCVLLEVALQPCGWLSSYVGGALQASCDVSYRNLDGVGTVHREAFPFCEILRTRVALTNVSQSGSTIFHTFEANVFLGDTPVLSLDKTVFGFFPREAILNQVGLPSQEEQLNALEEPSNVHIDLSGKCPAYFKDQACLPGDMLLMIDRVTGFWPKGGIKGVGRLRAEKDVDPAEWFFKAHFFQDPVQPGSLGLEAMIQLLQFFMLETKMHEGKPNAIFEPLALGIPMTWKYRGQVIPTNQRITITMDITEVERFGKHPFAKANGSLWVDGKRIYEVHDLGMRLNSTT